jgi:hypothetical protein
LGYAGEPTPLSFLFKNSIHITQVWKQIRAGNIWAEMASFPRVTFCDVTMNRLAQPAMHTLQVI